MEGVKDKILKLAAQVAGGQGVSVVDVEMTGSARKPTVRVFIDKEGAPRRWGSKAGIRKPSQSSR